MEKATLQWLRKEITEHITCRAILDSDFAGLYAIRDKEIPDVQVSCAFTA
jgi:hypothetical protein